MLGTGAGGDDGFQGRIELGGAGSGRRPSVVKRSYCSKFRWLLCVHRSNSQLDVDHALYTNRDLVPMAKRLSPHLLQGNNYSNTSDFVPAIIEEKLLDLIASCQLFWHLNSRHWFQSSAAARATLPVESFLQYIVQRGPRFNTWCDIDCFNVVIERRSTRKWDNAFS